MEACKDKSISGEAHLEKVKSKEEKGRLPVDDSLPVGICIGTKRSRDTSKSTKLCIQSKSIMERAKKIEANLNPQFPIFIKLIHQVTRNNYLRLPAKFCKNHMPNHDELIILIGENDEEYTVNFLAKHLFFSGGWTKFSLDNKLQSGDVVVFQLVSQFQFKVYIVRSDVDGTVELPNLNVNAKESNIGHIEEETSFEVVKDYSENSRNDLLTISSPFVDYKSFLITVNGFSLDSELSESIRFKYYELCFSQKSYLHECLNTHNPRFAAEMIVETVTLADAIRGCGVFTCEDEFTIWDKTLQGFELIGMSVDFLRSRLNHLRGLALECRETEVFKRWNEAKLEKTRLEKDILRLETMMNRLKVAKNVLQEEDILTFETTLVRLNDAMNVLQSEIDTLNANIHTYELFFKSIAGSPW